MNIICCCGY